MDHPLSPDALSQLTLDGRCFLHEQGSFVVRGRVAGFELSGGHWTLQVSDTELFDSSTGQWRPDLDSDEYGGSVDSEHTFQRDDDGLITLNGYGLVVYIAPEGAGWSDVDWPETDTFEGGRM